MLAFDRQGQRVGYGRGFYDKLVAECNSACKRVGFSFFSPVDRIDDVQPYDMPMHQVITPDEVFTF
jgi:5-formyltetrahydrofolate cyclo-ligase